MSILSTLAGSLALVGAGATGDETPNLDDVATSNVRTNIVLPADVTVKVFGRIQVDGTWATGDPPFETQDGAEFRRSRVGAKGDIGVFNYKAEYDFAGGDADFADVFLGWSDSPLGNATVGHFKEPISLEELTSSRFTTFAERSLPTVFAPARNTGIQFADSTERLAWQYGVFRSDSDAFGNDVGDGNYAVTGRLAGTVLQDEDNTVHLGISASNRSKDTVRFSARPEAHLLNSVADSGTIDTDGVILYGAEAAWVGGPWSVQGEYIAADVSVEVGEDVTYGGYYCEGSYYITGESRSYNRSNGKFVRPPVNEEFDGEGGMGAIQLAARYSMLDLNDGPTRDELADISLGVNWWLNNHTRVVANYVNSNFEDGPVDESANIFIVRFQIDF